MNAVKLLVAGLLVVIVVAAGVLVASLAPYLMGGLGTGGDPTATPTADEPTTLTATKTPPPPPMAETPTVTFQPTASSDELRFAINFERDQALRDWQVTTASMDRTSDSEGEATVVDGQLRLRVFRCHRVVVERSLGRVEGPLRVSFDWAAAAEEWYEYPDWRLVAANGSALNYTVTAGRDVSRPNKSSKRSGRLVATTSADTNVTLQFLVRPSQYCARANHGNTFLWVDNVTVVEPARTG